MTHLYCKYASRVLNTENTSLQGTKIILSNQNNLASKFLPFENFVSKNMNLKFCRSGGIKSPTFGFLVS